MAVTNSLELDIKAEAKKATDSLDTLIAKLNEVNSALNGMNTAKIAEMSQSIKGLKGVHLNTGSASSAGGNKGNAENQYRKANELLKTLTTTSTKANKGFLNLNSTMLKMAATWGTFYAAAYPVMRLFDKAWGSTKSAIDYVETYNYYSVTMAKMFSNLGEMSAEEFQSSYVNTLKSISEKMTGFTVGANGELFETYGKNLGADPERLMNYQARIGAVTNAVGLLGKTSANTQKALSMLSQDLSSLTNTDLDTVMTNLQSGLIGQSRALYKYGIDITQATLKTFALENGITKSVSAMSQSEKMQLRVLAILRQSKVAWGDMAYTVNSVANQYRIFGQNVSNLSRTLGNLFIPIISKVLPYTNALLISLRQLFSLLGFKLYGKNWLTDTLDGISSVSFGDDIADDIEEIGDSANSAAGKAKKLKQALMGIDELNIINTDTSGGSAGGVSGGGNVDLSDVIESALGDYEKMWNEAFASADNKAAQLANRITSYFKRGDFKGLGKWISDNVASELNGIDWKRVYKGAENFGTGLAEFLNGLIQPNTFYAVGKTVANSLNTGIKFAFNFAKTFDFINFGEAIAEYFNGEFENFNFNEFGQTVGRWTGGITKTIATAIRDIKWDTLFDGIKDGIQGFFKGLADSDVTIGDISLVLGAVVIKKILKLSWGAMVVKAISQQLAKGLATRIGIDIAANAGIGEALVVAFTTQMKNVAAKIPTLFAMLGKSGGNYANTIASYVFSPIATTITGIASTLGGATLAVHEFFDMWENGWNVVSEILKDMGLAAAGIGTVLLGLNPVFAAVAVAVAAIGTTAAIVAHDQLPDVGEAIKNALTVPGGVSLNEITSQVSENILKVGDKFNELASTIEKNERIKSAMQDSANSILEIERAMSIGTKSVDEGVKEIEQLFITLKNNTQEYYNGIANTILGVYGEGGVLEGAFKNYEEIAENTVLLGKKLTDEQQAAYDEYLKMEDKTSEKALSLLRKATGTKDEVTKAMEDAKNNINAIIGQINWDKFFDSEGNLIDEKGFKAELDKVTDAITQSQADVETAITSWNAELYGAMDKAIKEGDTQLADSYQALIDSNNSQMDLLKNQVAQMGVELTDAMQSDFLGKMRDAISQADSDTMAADIAGKMNKSFGVLSDDIEEQFNDLGIKGAGWGKDASQKFIDSIFDEDYFTERTQDFKAFTNKTLPKLFDDVTSQYEGFGKNTVEGYNKGISNSSSDDVLNNWMINNNKAIHDSILKFGSPSKTTEQYGKWSVDGYNIGVEKNMNSTKEYIDRWVKGINSLFENSVYVDFNSGLTKEFKTISDMFTEISDSIISTIETSSSMINDIFGNVWDGVKQTSIIGANSMISVFEGALNSIASGTNSFLRSSESALSRAAKESGTTFNGFGSVGTVKIPRVKIAAYSIGGFPEDGLFMANHNELVGQFSNGRTAVANNEQIVEGIRSGVASAVAQTLTPYLREIAANTGDTANNTDAIAKKPVQTLSDRSIAKANMRGQRSLGLQLRTT